MTMDMTKGPVMRSMLRFVVPMILGNLLQQCYNIVDTLIVGQFIGADALAAVGSAFTLMTFLTSILLGLCMGSLILRRNLEKDGFFNSHLVCTYSSVFPPTTAADYNVAWRYCGYESVASIIRKNGGSAYEVTPFFEPFPDSFDKICDRIMSLCSQPVKKYIYSYWNEPDYTMHRAGCYGDDAKQVLTLLEKQVCSLCEELENTLVIVTADHGHMDSKGVSLEDYPKITECLVRMPSIEPRALNFFVKEEKRSQFEQEFNKEFGGKFVLWTKEQVLDRKLFGPGAEHPNFRGMLGDYLAIAIDDYSAYNNRKISDDVSLSQCVA